MFSSESLRGSAGVGMCAASWVIRDYERSGTVAFRSELRGAQCVAKDLIKDGSGP